MGDQTGYKHVQMFDCASKFNQPLNGGYKPHCWAFIFTQYGVVNDSTKITGRRLFHKLPVFLVRRVALYAFGDHIGGFDTSQVTDMSCMFYDASSFNQPIGQWKTNQVTDMRGMFYMLRLSINPLDNGRRIK